MRHHLPVQGLQVPSLVRELRSHLLRDAAKHTHTHTHTSLKVMAPETTHTPLKVMIACQQELSPFLCVCPLLFVVD